jgi:hypothetical protein
MPKEIFDHHSSSAEPERAGKTRGADVPKAYDGGGDERERAEKVAKIAKQTPQGKGRYHNDNSRY